MKRHTILQVSDIHLSGERAYNYANWQAALTYVNASDAELTVLSGDVCLDDPDFEPDHVFAREQLERISGEWRVIPGNHDIGDSAPRPYMGQNVTDERLARYEKQFGPDHWEYELGNWRVVGLNSMLCDSDLAREAKQVEWLERTLAKDLGRPTILFSHKPLFIDAFDEDVRSHWCVTPDGRNKIAGILEKANIRLVASGHTHHYRTMVRNNVTYVWAPAVGHIDFNDPIPFNALTMSGIVRYVLDDNGVEFTLVVPEGMETWNAASTIKASGSMRCAPLLTPDENLNQRKVQAAE